MWCEHVRIKDVDSYRGTFRSTQGNSSVVSDKTVGGEGEKGLGEKCNEYMTLTSHLSKVFILTHLFNRNYDRGFKKLVKKDTQHSEFDEKTLLCALNTKDGATSISLLACAASCPTEFP